MKLITVLGILNIIILPYTIAGNPVNPPLLPEPQSIISNIEKILAEASIDYAAAENIIALEKYKKALSLLNSSLAGKDAKDIAPTKLGILMNIANLTYLTSPGIDFETTVIACNNELDYLTSNSAPSINFVESIMELNLLLAKQYYDANQLEQSEYILSSTINSLSLGIKDKSATNSSHYYELAAEIHYRLLQIVRLKGHCGGNYDKIIKIAETTINLYSVSIDRLSIYPYVIFYYTDAICMAAVEIQMSGLISQSLDLLTRHKRIFENHNVHTRYPDAYAQVLKHLGQVQADMGLLNESITTYSGTLECFDPNTTIVEQMLIKAQVLCEICQSLNLLGSCDKYKACRDSLEIVKNNLEINPSKISYPILNARIAQLDSSACGRDKSRSVVTVLTRAIKELELIKPDEDDYYESRRIMAEIFLDLANEMDTDFTKASDYILRAEAVIRELLNVDSCISWNLDLYYEFELQRAHTFRTPLDNSIDVSSNILIGFTESNTSTSLQRLFIKLKAATISGSKVSSEAVEVELESRGVTQSIIDSYKF